MRRGRSGSTESRGVSSSSASSSVRCRAAGGHGELGSLGAPGSRRCPSERAPARTAAHGLAATIEQEFTGAPVPGTNLPNAAANVMEGHQTAVLFQIQIQPDRENSLAPAANNQLEIVRHCSHQWQLARPAIDIF
ncbi:unnamed protein product [Urochloa humidicola]